MSNKEDFTTKYNALNNFVVNCPALEELERLLGGFNLFKVLKFEYGELRHSNVLAWLMDPEESHGLGDTFLKKWLMRVIHEAGRNDLNLKPVDIDAWNIYEVEVRREWRNIDLLLILNLIHGENFIEWRVCIENKVNSSQHSKQLERYHGDVQAEFKDHDRNLFLFLTKNEEEPHHKSYISAQYTQVHDALKECVAARSNFLGTEPKALLDSYLRLLEEKFMDESMQESEVARIARLIYKQHRQALDIIFEHRPNRVANIAEALRSVLKKNESELEIHLDACDSRYVRFIPRDWEHPGNRHGTAWRESKRTVLFQLDLNGKSPSLTVHAGQAPQGWLDPMWETSKSAPFRKKSNRSAPTPTWCKLHHAGDYRPGIQEEVDDVKAVADELYKWLAQTYLNNENQSVIRIIAESLPDLDRCFVSSSDQP